MWKYLSIELLNKAGVGLPRKLNGMIRFAYALAIPVAIIGLGMIPFEKKIGVLVLLADISWTALWTLSGMIALSFLPDKARILVHDDSAARKIKHGDCN